MTRPMNAEPALPSGQSQEGDSTASMLLY